MENEIGKILDQNPANRQAALRAWLAYHGVQMKDLARMIGVHPSMMTHIVKGNRSPAKRIEQLVALGIPRHLLPEPSRPPGRPSAKKQSTPVAPSIPFLG
ncbi:transcriptional regulator with XRE-family HTH domain [Desulfobaculum xiamenense]|uniref:Transcriptional regulator with XRE-family HTH domain n=1 Tax=Desulfobaculum xiamenense TaxID=995050 RepID=A0A846QUZ8_9BACT|nr:helix-turn-helix transcriptional regulator [Desulfobaculum xiamenense]NJB68469.1 transcriptional regulator with XRE-family HTH domain [Desulfobaculum xiamenense]